MQYAADRRDPRRLDPYLRPALRRALQPGRKYWLRLAQRVAVVRHGGLCRSASARWPCRSMDRTSDVRIAGIAALDHGANRSRAVACGSCRDLRSSADHTPFFRRTGLEVSREVDINMPGTGPFAHTWRCPRNCIGKRLCPFPYVRIVELVRRHEMTNRP